MSSLIAFFSRKDENYVGGILKNLEVGNTCRIASIIKEFKDGDTFQIDITNVLLRQKQIRKTMLVQS